MNLYYVTANGEANEATDLSSLTTEGRAILDEIESLDSDGKLERPRWVESNIFAAPDSWSPEDSEDYRYLLR